MKETWTFGALLALRCPVCGGNTFRAGLFRTARACAQCGEDFEPESGFFAGAIYPMYGMSALIGGAVGLMAACFGASAGWMFALGAAAILISSPLIFWWARLGFLYTNHRFFGDKA
jgi:uncharacterized protein (DUF983 family)